MSTAGAVAGIRASTPSVRDSVEREFGLEDARLLDPLMDRLGRVAELLDHGHAVDPTVIAKGLELWGRYGREIHHRRLVRILGLLPKANSAGGPRSGSPPLLRRSEPVAGPAHGKAPQESEGMVHGVLTVFPSTPYIRNGKKANGSESKRTSPLRPKSPTTTSATTALHEFQQMVLEEGSTQERMNDLEGMLKLYRTETYASREQLASVLRAFVISELSWAKFERDFVLRVLSEELPVELVQPIRKAIEEIASARGGLQTALRAYLDEPLVLRTRPARGPRVDVA